jgi:DNA-binding CsgD family transcriptional regulator
MSALQATLSDVIGAIGTPDFAATTARSLSRFAGFDLAAFFLHRSSGARVLFDNFDIAGCRAGVETYARHTWPVNPMVARRGVVRACEYAGRPAVALRTLHPYLVADAHEELGYRTAGWPERQEEIGLYLSGWGGVIELGFYRPRALSVAPDTTLGALDEIALPIAVAFERHRALSRPVAPETLSPREAEICDLLLIGCSSDAIALRLGISRHTVKDHRKHIFRKLGVASLAELFATIH